MRFIGRALLATLLFISPSQAQLPLLNIGPGTLATSVGGYVGPGDLNSGYAMWWGARAYSSTTATALANAFQLCTAADALCTTIHVTSTGGLNASDLTTSGCSGISTCTVKIKYDQSGNGRDLTQATIANRDTFDPAANGGLGEFVTGSASAYVTSATYTRAQPFTMTAVANRSGGTGERKMLTDKNNGTVDMAFNGGVANQLSFYAGNAVNATVADSAYHSITGVFNGASALYGINSSITTGQNFGANSPSDNIAWTCFSGCGGNTVTTKQTEAGIHPSAFTSGDVTALNANEKTYWGY